jgi:hypothetical protein
MGMTPASLGTIWANQEIKHSGQIGRRLNAKALYEWVQSVFYIHPGWWEDKNLGDFGRSKNNPHQNHFDASFISHQILSFFGL